MINKRPIYGEKFSILHSSSVTYNVSQNNIIDAILNKTKYKYPKVTTKVELLSCNFQ